MGNPFKKVESDTFIYQWVQVAVALVKAQGLHEGLWRVGLEFDLSAANVKIGENRLVPGAFLPVKTVSLKRVETPDLLTVDAAVVNPAKRIIMVPGSSVN